MRDVNYLYDQEKDGWVLYATDVFGNWHIVETVGEPITISEEELADCASYNEGRRRAHVADVVEAIKGLPNPW